MIRKSRMVLADPGPLQIVLFIGTRFSNLYTSVHTPA
jgi:hypothetical protein